MVWDWIEGWFKRHPLADARMDYIFRWLEDKFWVFWMLLAAAGAIGASWLCIQTFLELIKNW